MNPRLLSFGVIVFSLFCVAYTANLSSSLVPMGTTTLLTSNVSPYDNNTKCVVLVNDQLNNTIESWITNPDSAFFVQQTITINDKYAVGYNYTVNLICGSDSDQALFAVEEGGNSIFTMYLHNLSSYAYAHPGEALGSVIVFIVLLWLVGEIFHR